MTATKNNNWKVVLTGLDATLPSTHPNSQFVITTTTTTTTTKEEEKETIVIPTYKIGARLIYAMSKLGQYYMVANTIAKLVGNDDVVHQTEPIIAKIVDNINQADDNGKYHGPKDDGSMITMEELDGYSKKIMLIERQLENHFVIAKGISICYTPLHAKPWTEQAFSSSSGSLLLSPKAFVLEQVVKRLKNAISIEQAVDCHFL